MGFAIAEGTEDGKFENLLLLGRHLRSSRSKRNLLYRIDISRLYCQGGGSANYEPRRERSGKSAEWVLRLEHDSLPRSDGARLSLDSRERPRGHRLRPRSEG